MPQQFRCKFYFFFFFFTFLTTTPTFFTAISATTNTLTGTQSISGNRTLVSPGDVFELGFFSPGNSGKWYVGIWYKNIPDRTYVWIANRDTPLSDSSGTFTLQERNLALLDQNRSLVWSSNITRGENPIALLLDSGNLVLREPSSDEFLWQSFDFPTDTLLPEMKLGLDQKTGFNRFITSWRSADDPSTGDFSFKMDNDGLPEVFLLKGQTRIYRSGPWNGIGFSGVPDMKPLDYMEFYFVQNQSEVYYGFTVSNGNIRSRLAVSPSGVLQRLTWISDERRWNVFWYAPDDQCDGYGECGPFGVCDSNDSPVCNCPTGFQPKNWQAWNLRDGSDGCVRMTELGCPSDKFVRLRSMKVPESERVVVKRNVRDLVTCREECVSNCSCTAYARTDIRSGGSGCVMWFGRLFDMRLFADGGQDLYLRLAASDLGNGGSSKSVIVGTTVGIGIAILVLGLGSYLVCKRRAQQRKAKPAEPKGVTDRSQDCLLNEAVITNKREHYSGENRSDELELPLFDFSTIATATNNFSFENKLGRGGFGTVYKGRLVEGQEIAVKRLSKTSGQGAEEFKNEVRLIARLQHINLVRLLGCCVDLDEKLLVYEYMENRSLDFILFSKEKSSLLNWERRFNIICGVARGLLYLHQDSRFRIVHRDLKASNILLDEEMNPKISDFGTARLFGRDQTEASTNRVVGTYGYMSPEYAMDGLFSVKSDVFSFGVLVLEIVSGKKNRAFYHSNSELNLLGHAWTLWREGKGLELIDPAVGDTYPEEEVLRCIKVGLLCVEEHAVDRPKMSSVVLMLSSETVIMLEPKAPGVCLGRGSFQTDSLSIKPEETFTVNRVTVTTLDAR